MRDLLWIYSGSSTSAAMPNARQSESCADVLRSCKCLQMWRCANNLQQILRAAPPKCERSVLISLYDLFIISAGVCVVVSDVFINTAGADGGVRCGC